ncbi:MAG: ThuA domain-containing protein [Verrucomicrobia bacterium]|nr:ThuA domain-containing protein [Verrucomicrobiota bacterium]
MITFSLRSVLAAMLFLAGFIHAASIPVLIVDGQNNHDWKSTTPHLQKVLEQTGLFKVEVATSPAKGGDMSAFKPAFGRYRVILSNYNGEPWSKETREALVRFVREGGGFVSVHAANNAFPEWPEYNEMIGLGGWGDRNEKWGPYLRFRNGRFVPDPSPGRGGSHGSQHGFVLDTRDTEHPIMKGLPSRWMHAKDELYDRLRGPAKHVTVLASALSTRETNGSGEHEPLLMTIAFGAGRVFHTALGHNNGSDLTSQRCVGFIVTLQRGVEWAAQGKVTQKVPPDFPSAEKASLRE